jgi:hypothetical protein
MIFNESIKQLRENHQIPQRKLEVVLDIDTASYCKIDKGGHRAWKEYILFIAKMLQSDGKDIVDKVLNITKQKIEYLKSKSK